MNPMLSVIIPVYNTEDYLDKCIKSVLNQTFRDFEVILVDDFSTDSSGRICDEYAKKYDFIKVIHKEHGGPTQTRKAGLERALGTYVIYMDSDDRITPDMYEYMMKKILKYNADIGICDIVIETEKSRIPLYRDIPGGFYDKERLKKEIYPCMLFSETRNEPVIAPSLCNKIIRKTILEKVLPSANENIYYGEDAVCMYPCMLDADSVYIAKDKFFYIYTQTEYSLSRKYDKRLLSKLPLLISLFDEEFEERGFDGKTQLNLYAASQLVFSIRNELLFNKKKTLAKKVKELKEYLLLPRFKEVFQSVKSSKLGRLFKFKVLLLEKKQIYLLYVMFCLRERTLLSKERKND